MEDIKDFEIDNLRKQVNHLKEMWNLINEENICNSKRRGGKRIMCYWDLIDEDNIVFRRYENEYISKN